MQIIPLLISVITSIVATTLGIRSTVELIQFRKEQEPDAHSLEFKMEQLARTIANSKHLMSEVGLELEAQAARAERLKIEAEQAEALAALNKKEREAVAELVRGEVQEQGRRSDRKQIRANLLFFLGGVAASSTVSIILFALSE